MDLSIKAEGLFSVASFQISNSLLSASLISLTLIVFFVIYAHRLKINPTRFQILVEMVIDALYDLAKSVLGHRIARNVFPFILTFFIFIIFSNWFGLLPFTGSIGFVEKKYGEADTPSNVIVLGTSGDHGEEVRQERVHYELIPFFRSPSADLNFTIAMALISFFIIQYNALKESGIAYLGKFFDYRVSIGKGWRVFLTPAMFIVNFVWKTLELILEFSKIVSFSFRLFGNIFAGEVLLAVVTGLSFGLITLPFLGFELFVGFIQAVVFVFLTMVFIRMAIDVH